MTNFAAFFSYSRFDDGHDLGYLRRLQAKLAAEVQVQTGEPFPIFIDQDDILIGERWRERIERTLDSTTLLVTVITPSFFKSEKCRDEIAKFRAREQALGLDDLIVPVYYVDTPEIRDPATRDEVGRDLQSRQYVDWRELRFDSLDSNATRRQLAELARQIAIRLHRPVQSSAQPQNEDKPAGATGPGAIELIAELEDALPLLTGSLEGLTSVSEDISMIATEATSDMERASARPNASRAKLASIQRYATRLEEPADRATAFAADYAYQIDRVDAGVDGLATMVRYVDNDEDISAAEGLRDALTQLAEQARGAVETTRDFIESMDHVRELSSTVRPAYTRISGAYGLIVDSYPRIQSWSHRLDDAIQQSRA